MNETKPTTRHGPWLREKEAAAYLGMPLSTLRMRRRQRVIRFYRPAGGKLVFYKREDLDAYMEGGEQPTVDLKRGPLGRRK